VLFRLAESLVERHLAQKFTLVHHQALEARRRVGNYRHHEVDEYETHVLQKKNSRHATPVSDNCNLKGTSGGSENFERQFISSVLIYRKYAQLNRLYYAFYTEKQLFEKKCEPIGGWAADPPPLIPPLKGAQMCIIIIIIIIIISVIITINMFNVA